jgi:hypothetical protein
MTYGGAIELTHMTGAVSMATVTLSLGPVVEG